MAIELEITTMWCQRHLEPFRAEWPKGYAPAMLELFQRAISMPAIINAAHGDTSNLQEALGRFKPICCFVSAEDLAAVYKVAGVK